MEFSRSSTGPSAERLEYQSTGYSCGKTLSTFVYYKLRLFLQICISTSPDWHNSSHINEQSEARYIPVTKRSSNQFSNCIFFYYRSLMSVLYNILSLLSRSSHKCSLFKTRTLFFLQYCNELTGEDDCWLLIHQIRIIPSSTAL